MQTITTPPRPTRPLPAWQDSPLEGSEGSSRDDSKTTKVAKLVLNRSYSPPPSTSKKTPISSSDYASLRSLSQTPKKRRATPPSAFQTKALAVYQNLQINKNDVIFPLQNSEKHGFNNVILFFHPSSPRFYLEIPNEQLVIKTIGNFTFEEKSQSEISEMLKLSLAQYKTLQRDFSYCPLQEKPYVEIYNPETMLEDGYTILEKVTTFAQPLWEQTTKIKDLSPKDLFILEQIKNLFQYSYLKGDEATGLDLVWDNIGLRGNTVVIFDYFEIDDPFYLLAHKNLENLSQQNPEIRNYILKDLKEKLPGNLKDYYNSLMANYP